MPSFSEIAQDLIEIQVARSAPQPSVTETATDMVLPSKRSADRLLHFPENVYDLNPESHLSRLLKVLLGDAGAGRVRKRINIQRMRATLQGSHFYDLDRFYGPLFGIRRVPDELLNINPYAGTATRDEWDDTFARDASFRSRIEQFAMAIPYGPTPVGMELIAEAVLAVDCEINEFYIQADSTYKTWQELIDQFGSGAGEDWADMQDGETWAEHTGLNGTQIVGNDRRLFIVRPKKPISLADAYFLSKVLDRLKPADARYEIDIDGVQLHQLMENIGPVYADSVHWEIINKVIPYTPATNLPYAKMTGSPEEQPKPPFAGYQGEAWSYVQDLAGVSAAHKQADIEGLFHTPVQRVTYANGTHADFPPAQAILPARVVQSGRAVSDAILVSYPYATQFGILDQFATNRTSEAISRLFVDGVPLDKLTESVKTVLQTDPFQQNPENRYWVSPSRGMNSPTEEIIEIRLNRESWVNYVTFEAVRYPHRVIVEVYDTKGGRWIERYRRSFTDSTPRLLQPGEKIALKAGHPDHAYPNHWEKVSQKIKPSLTSRVRLRLRRIEGVPPRVRIPSAAGGPISTKPVNYSLAVRSFDAGYRISNRADFDFIESKVLGQTLDILGSQVLFEAQEQSPVRAIDGSDITAWRSEPQPVSYAVVNFYIDARGPTGEPQVIDRFYVNPTHGGASLSIYYSDVPETVDDIPGFEALEWHPIPRNYFLQKGYLHLPTTRATYFKFEFSNLTAEPYESFIPITRLVKLFPVKLIQELGISYGHATEAMLPGFPTAIKTAEDLRYKDALRSLGTPPLPVAPGQYGPTEALFVPDPARQTSLRHQSWQFGFIPWHQSSKQYPRFTNFGSHTYEVTQVRHDTKMAFWVGLREIQAYRTKFEESENRVIYFDTYDDFRNLQVPFTWAMNPGEITTEGTTPPVTLTSATYHSKDNVKAVQFATIQSDPEQLLYDHTFRDPNLKTYTWDDPDFWLRVGDVQLIYDSADYGVLNIRHSVVPPKALGMTKGMVHPIVAPIFKEYDLTVDDDASAAATEGGMRSPLAGLSPQGRAYAAARFTMLTDQTSPLYLRVYDVAGDVLLAEKEMEARNGETVEQFIGFDIPDPTTVVYLVLEQEGKSDDSWKVYAMSLFDDGMLWEWSVDGGTNWYPAQEIRNNQHGILTLPAVGNQLKYRVTAYKDNRWVSAIKIRPHYVGTGEGRPTGTNRGPNVSVFDHDVPIQSDPMFTSWTKPIPYWWFAASRRFPHLVVEGGGGPAPGVRFYSRPVTDTVAGISDVATGEVIMGRMAQDDVSVMGDVAETTLSLTRPVSDSVAGLTDSASLIHIWTIGEAGKSEISETTWIGERAPAPGVPPAPTLPVIGNTLRARWDATTLSLADGVDVTTWLDTTASINMTPLGGVGTGPEFDVNSSPLGDKPGVKFVNNERLGVGGLSPTLGVVTFFMVMRNPPSDADRHIMAPYSNNYALAAEWEGVAGRWIFGQNQFSFIEFTDAALLNAHCLWTWVHAGTGSVVRANQTQRATGNYGATSSGSLYLGDEGGGQVDITLHEILVYTGVVSAGDIDQIEDYLYAKWFT